MATETCMENRVSEAVLAERPACRRTFRPNVDIIEKPAELLLVADLPGAKADELEIKCESGMLSIDAPVSPRQPDGQKGSVDSEYAVGDYARRFKIGDGIDADRIEAEFVHGVLTLHLPKTATVMPRRISVRQN